MRLICPNCDAQYEVDERVIPDAGRDVQCSNCGHAWFQHPEGYEGGTEAPLHSVGQAEERPGPAGTKDEPQAALDTLPSDAPETAAPVDQDASDALEQPEAQAREPESSPAPKTDGLQRRGIDDGVRDILRAEATRETSARKSAPESLETQEELGLAERPSAREMRSTTAQERMARLRGLDVEENVNVTRRDLLPDIEEINSSLSPIGSEDIVDDFAEPTRSNGGFRRGFLLMLTLAALVVGLYIYAPLLSEKVPAIAPYLDIFVGLIDQARAWLDEMVKLALSNLKSNGA